MLNYKSICTACNTMIKDKVLDCPKCRALGTVIPLPAALWETEKADGKKSASYLPVGWASLDYTLGGGLARGSLTTLCGNPGVGKSTLTLQISQAVASQNKSVLYFSTEEDIDRLKARARRIKTTSPNVFIKAGRTLKEFMNCIPFKKPDLLIVDSLSRLFDDEDKATVGSITQMKRCGLQLMSLSGIHDWAILAIVHTTKSGEMAGHKGLAFDSDVNLILHFNPKTLTTALIPVKNRFGATDEIVFFKMESGGLFITQPDTIPHIKENMVGVGYTVALYEGRPLVIEVQSTVKLAIGNKLGIKVFEGFNRTRLNTLIRLLSHMGYAEHINKCDIFLRSYSPMVIKDENTDLSVIAVILSAVEKFALPNDTIFIGKVDYDGNILPTADIDDRLESAHRRGFKKCISGVGKKDILYKGIENIQIENIREIVPYFTTKEKKNITTGVSEFAERI